VSTFFTGSGSGDIQPDRDHREYGVDDNALSSFTYDSSLMNGRGRYPEDMPYPLSEYRLTVGVETRFRLAVMGD